MKVAFLTAGGIAPCLSASIVSLIKFYNNSDVSVEFIGYLNGYKGLLKGKSIKIPKIAAPVAVAKTIIAVVIDFIPPMYLTPYNSAHVDEPKTFAKPLDIPINPKSTKEEIGLSNKK